MKILYISDRLNAPDGSAVHGREFVAAVERLGHEIITYPALQPEPASLPQPVPKAEKDLVYYLKKVNRQTFRYYLRRTSGHASEWLNAWDGLRDGLRDYPRLERLVREHRPAAIVYRVRLFNQAPFRISRRFHIPVLCELNTLKSIEEKLGNTARVTRLTRSAEARAVRAADGIFTVASTIARAIDRYRPPCDVEVIPNGVDTEKFDPGRFDKNRSKAGLGLRGKIVLGYVGSYKKWHGLDTSIQVIAALNRKDTRYHLLLIGDGNCYQEIDRLIARHNLGHCVTRLKTIAHEQVPFHLAAFDYALMTYPLMDQFYFSPLKMFEYMSMAIPVVATAIGQIKEILTHGQTGILAAEPTAENFAAAIAEYSGRSDHIGRNARKMAVEHYSWLANARKVIDFCDKIMAPGIEENTVGEFLN